MLSHSTLTMMHRQAKTHCHMNTARKDRAKRRKVIVPTTWRSCGLRLTACNVFASPFRKIRWRSYGLRLTCVACNVFASPFRKIRWRSYGLRLTCVACNVFASPFLLLALRGSLWGLRASTSLPRQSMDGWRSHIQLVVNSRTIRFEITATSKWSTRPFFGWMGGCLDGLIVG